MISKLLELRVDIRKSLEIVRSQSSKYTLDQNSIHPLLIEKKLEQVKLLHGELVLLTERNLSTLRIPFIFEYIEPANLEVTTDFLPRDGSSINARSKRIRQAQGVLATKKKKTKKSYTTKSIKNNNQNF